MYNSYIEKQNSSFSLKRCREKKEDNSYKQQQRGPSSSKGWPNVESVAVITDRKKHFKINTLSSCKNLISYWPAWRFSQCCTVFIHHQPKAGTHFGSVYYIIFLDYWPKLVSATSVTSHFCITQKWGPGRSKLTVFEALVCRLSS